MFSVHRTILLAITTSVLLLPAWAEPVTLPGTSISVDVPVGFEVSRTFSGLQNMATGASFLFAELPANAKTQLTDVFGSLAKASAVFEPQGVTLREEIRLDTDRTGIAAYRGTQTVGDLEFRKWVSLFVKDNVLIVSYQAPPPGDDETLIIATFESIRIGAPLTLEEQVDALPYSFGSIGEMRIVGVLAGSGTILTIGDLDTDPENSQPFLIVAPSLGDSGLAGNDPIAYSKALLNQAATLTIDRYLDEKEVIVVGWPGYRLEALGTHTATGKKLHIAQWIGYSEHGYFRIIAQSPVELWESALPHFETVVAGLARH